jgi:hypothetical protein
MAIVSEKGMLMIGILMTSLLTMGINIATISYAQQNSCDDCGYRQTYIHYHGYADCSGALKKQPNPTAAYIHIHQYYDPNTGEYCYSY